MKTHLKDVRTRLHKQHGLSERYIITSDYNTHNRKPLTHLKSSMHTLQNISMLAVKKNSSWKNKALKRTVYCKIWVALILHIGSSSCWAFQNLIVSV